MKERPGIGVSLSISGMGDWGNAKANDGVDRDAGYQQILRENVNAQEHRGKPMGYYEVVNRPKMTPHSRSGSNGPVHLDSLLSWVLQVLPWACWAQRTRNRRPNSLQTVYERGVILSAGERWEKPRSLGAKSLRDVPVMLLLTTEIETITARYEEQGHVLRKECYTEYMRVFVSSGLPKCG